MTTTSAKNDVDREAILAALGNRERPPLPNALATSLTFGWRAMLKIRHVPEQLFDVTIFPIMFTLMFTFLFGGALAGSIEGYVQFLLPGILVQTVVMITMYTGTTLRTDIEKGVFDRFRSLPIWRPSPLVGMLLGDAARFSLASFIICVLGVIIGWRPEGGVTGVVLGVLLTLVFSFSIGWVWTFISLVVRSANAVMGVSMMVIMPLTFVSNIFVDPSTMPGWLQAFVNINPISHLVTATRDLMSGTPVGIELLMTLIYSAALVAVFGSLTMWRYRDAK
ncbi:MAG: ABC transporter permease [Pseudoclavibacter sp.]